MVERPIYFPSVKHPCLFGLKRVPLKWHSGFAPSQKLRNVAALHENARNFGFSHVLEVSSKSEFEIGRRLSSFNLRLDTSLGNCTLESIYQGSKIFQHGGPYLDLYLKEPKDAKRDARIKNSGDIIGFYLDDRSYPNFPLNAFYDWIYIRALSSHEAYISKNLTIFDGFSDVEFNPNISINTQARAISIYITLMKRNGLQIACNDYFIFEKYINLHEEYCNETFKW